MSVAFLELLKTIGSAFGTSVKPVGAKDPDDNAIAISADYSGGQYVNLDPDGYLVDAFGRARVSRNLTVFESSLVYGKNPILWEDVLTAGGTSTFQTNESSVKLSVTTASGDKAVRSTKQYYRYIPGKSQTVTLTCVLGAKKANVRKRVGLFDERDGLFFEQDGSNLKVVTRTYTSGSAVDTAVNQSAWNIDKLNGTGQSGITLDETKAQIMFVDFQWLGVGSIWFGFVIDGKKLYCHKINNANSADKVYMATPHLPIRYEIENIAVAASGTDLIQICSAIGSEEGYDNLSQPGLLFSADSGLSTITAGNGVLTPIVSIRIKTTFSSKPNRGIIVPLAYEAIGSAKGIARIIKNATLGGGTSWGSVGSDSLAEYDISSTTIASGTTIYTGFISKDAGTSSGIAKADLPSKTFLSLDVAGSTPDTLTFAAAGLGGNTNIGASLIWKELY
jgi:hypothetical protein